MREGEGEGGWGGVESRAELCIGVLEKLEVAYGRGEASAEAARYRTLDWLVSVVEMLSGTNGYPSEIPWSSCPPHARTPRV